MNNALAAERVHGANVMSHNMFMHMVETLQACMSPMRIGQTKAMTFHFRLHDTGMLMCDSDEGSGSMVLG